MDFRDGIDHHHDGLHCGEPLDYDMELVGPAQLLKVHGGDSSFTQGFAHAQHNVGRR
jgi:hypothetical protein